MTGTAVRTVDVAAEQHVARVSMSTWVTMIGGGNGKWDGHDKRRGNISCYLDGPHVETG